MSEQAVPAPRLRDIPGIGRKLIIAGVVAVIGLTGWALIAGRLGLPPMHPHWPDLSRLAAASIQIKLHLTGALTALAIGIVLLAGVKGTQLHKVLGWTWVVAMGTTAISSFWIHVMNPNGLSFIHFLSGWTVISLPAAIFAIKRRKVAAHARAMTAMFVGGLLVAGALSFLPGRLMWTMVFG